MDSKKFQFLTAVVGKEGALALQKAASRSTYLEAAILPRAIVSWLEASQDYLGGLPGVENTHLSLTKSEAGFTGDISIGEGVYHFTDSSILHVAAAMVVALEGDKERVAIEMPDRDLAKLGKSVDLLVKARECSRQLMKAKGEKLHCCVCNSEYAGYDDDGKVYCRAHDKKDLDKLEAPGGQGKPRPPIQPIAPTMQPSNVMKPGKKPAGAASMGSTPGMPSAKPINKSIKITKSQAQARCAICGAPQMRDLKFVGCYCFTGLSKSVSVRPLESAKFYVELEFDSDWDTESIDTLVQAFGGR